MAIQYNFLAPIDQKVRDRGYDFVSQNKYLDDSFKPTSGISYEGDGSPVSYANSGIMTQAPIPGPLKYTPPLNDGGGRDPEGPAPDTGAVTADDYGYGVVGDMGMTEEEQAGVDSINNANIGLTGAMKAAFAYNTLGPIAAMHSISKSQKKAKQDAIDKAKAAQTQRDFDAAMAQGQGFYDSLNEGRGASVSQESREQAGAGYDSVEQGSPFAKGGRVGYFFGGRVKYKSGGRVSFKNGGLASIL